jgi:hypothetical protein
MDKKPKLTVVGPTTTNPSAPPGTLGKAGTSLWQSIMSEYDIQDSGGIAMLAQAAAAADGIAECDEIIARDGPVIRSKFGSKEHPLLRHQLALRSFIVRTLHRLGLDVEPIKSVGRPERGIGWTGNDD